MVNKTYGYESLADSSHPMFGAILGPPEDDKPKGDTMSDTTNKDFEAQLAGGFILLRPVSEAARTWVKDHLPEDTPALGQHLAIETRHAPPIFDGIEDDGLTIA